MAENDSRSESNTYLPAGMPVPEAMRDGLDREFWEAAKRHELVVQRCNSCGTFQFGPEWICYKCHAADLGWHRVSGRGRIYSWERVWHPAHPALKSRCPYLVVVVELPDAGSVRMVGNVLGDPMRDVEFDAPVEAVFEDHPEGHTLIQWRLANHLSGSPSRAGRDPSQSGSPSPSGSDSSQSGPPSRSGRG